MIKDQREVSVFLKNFESVARWDGEKYYITLDTENPKGTLTIMKSTKGEFYYHRKNERYWDIKAIKIENDILLDIIWAFRKAINKSIKEMVV